MPRPPPGVDEHGAGVIFYVFAVITTNLVGAAFHDWLGTVGRLLCTLFQVMTLESWSMGISWPNKEVFPYAGVFFIPFILIATFTMLNLFIGLVVSAMQTFSDEDKPFAAGQQPPDPAKAGSHDLHTRLRALRSEMAELRELLRQRPAAEHTS